MPVSVQMLTKILEKLAPKRLAEKWDNVGLQIGSYQDTVNKVLIALDLTEAVVEEAKKVGADFIITHHPFIFKPLQAIRTDLMPGKLVKEIILAGIGVYAAHTNLDLASGGVNDALAHCLGLKEKKVLRPYGHEALEKIVVFVPKGYEDKVRQAMTAAGAGWIGNYSDCTFQTPGIGTFLPREGTDPFLGEKGKLEKAEEIRLETIMPSAIRKRVVQAMLKAHPYEEVAYDIYPLLNEGEPYGLGRVGTLEKPLELAEFCQLVKDRLNISFVRVAGELKRPVQKVAICGGAGSELLEAAKFAGADVLLTADVKYHEAQAAENAGIVIIDAGHDATERVIVPVLCNYVREELKNLGQQVEIIASTVETNPWKIF
ncbi:MAG: Nif3-like dinuclear metal center hexameric protein [Firmicutes bacterium]|nr:Nif3-like dinuclear metal center hexameric protein [Bacillota bacterium]